MSTQPYERAIAAARTVLENVGAEQLGNQSPCESWKVSDVINHLIGAQHYFSAALKGEHPSDGGPDFAADDFVTAFDEASAEALAAFGQDGVMGRMIHLPFGQMPGAAVLGLATSDTFTHAWDIAKGTGQSTDLDPELAEQILEQSKANIQDAFRGPDGKAPFGPEQPADGAVTNADKLAAFLGRSV